MQENTIGHGQSMNSSVKFKVYQKSPSPEYSHTITDRITIGRVIRDHILNQKQQQSGWYPLVNDTKDQYFIRRFVGIIDGEDVYDGDIFQYEYFNAIGKKCYSNGYIGLEEDELRYVLFTETNRYVELSQITSDILGNIFDNPNILFDGIGEK